MPDKPINFAARFEFLTALEMHWPDVMKSLLVNAFRVYQACLKTIARSLAPQDLAGLADALERVASSDQVEVAVRAWAEMHGFQDVWLRDVARQTMKGWAGGGTTSKWTYFPKELETLKFQPDFGYWIPTYAKWPEFKRLTDQPYRSALAKYRAEVSTVWGEGHPKLSQSAGWTVLWQRGKSPEAIQTHHRKTTGRNVSLANIQQQVHAFADAAGLSLRASKGGPQDITPTRRVEVISNCIWISGLR